MSIAPILQDQASPAVSIRGPEGLVRAAAWIIALIAREVRIRRDMRLLAEMDDAMLRDVGLDRTQIEPAVRHGRPFLGC